MSVSQGTSMYNDSIDLLFLKKYMQICIAALIRREGIFSSKKMLIP